MYDTVKDENGEEKYVDFEKAKLLMQKLIQDMDSIKLIETLNLK